MIRCSQASTTAAALAAPEPLGPELLAHISTCAVCGSMANSAQRFDTALDRVTGFMAQEPMPDFPSHAAPKPARRPSFWGFAAAVIIGTVLTSVAIASFRGDPSGAETPPPNPSASLEPQPALSSDERAYCTATEDPIGGPSAVVSVGQAFLEWDAQLVRDESVAQHPQYTTACQIAFQLWHLTRDQWDWCFTDANRQTFLGPAVQALGMGEDEEAGLDSFAEAPGDDPAEYAQACRFSYDNWRSGGVAPISAPSSMPFFSLTTAEEGWCDDPANAVTLAWAAMTLGIEIEADASDAEVLLGQVRACRFAYVIQRAPVTPEFVFVRDEAGVLSADAVQDATRRLKALVSTETCVVVLFANAPPGWNPPQLDDADMRAIRRDCRGRFFELIVPVGQRECCAVSYSDDRLQDFANTPGPSFALFQQGKWDEGLEAWLTDLENALSAPHSSLPTAASP